MQFNHIVVIVIVFSLFSFLFLYYYSNYSIIAQIGYLYRWNENIR